MNADCVEVSKIYRENECLIIVKDIPHKYGADFEINGRSLKTGKDTLYDEENRWFCNYYENIEKGDTIIKKKGELVFSIHKKDTILKFNWECEGKIYN
jgi:hypothetical protein